MKNSDQQLPYQGVLLTPRTKSWSFQIQVDRIILNQKVNDAKLQKLYIRIKCGLPMGLWSASHVYNKASCLTVSNVGTTISGDATL